MIDDVAVARALHILAILHWIGGVAFVTLVVLPMSRAMRDERDAVALFEAIEKRFSRQVRLSIAVAGATGLWMTYRLDAWYRFAEPSQWWMWAMVGVWSVFAIAVFIIEPAFHAAIERRMHSDPRGTLRALVRSHGVLLAVSALTILGAAAGSHGYAIF